VTESLSDIGPRALRGVELCLLSYWREPSDWEPNKAMRVLITTMRRKDRRNWSSIKLNPFPPSNPYQILMWDRFRWPVIAKAPIEPAAPGDATSEVDIRGWSTIEGNCFLLCELAKHVRG
jgi:hypothetical protein